MAMILTNKAKEAIRGNRDLYSDIATVMDIAPGTLTSMLSKDTRRLTEYTVIQEIKKHTGMNDKEILCKPKKSA